MQSNEIRDAGKIAGTMLGGGVELIEDLHMAIAKRSFGPPRPGARSAQIAHDRTANTVYGILAGASRAMPRLAASVVAARVSPTASPLGASPAGNATVGALNGMWGDRLADSSSSLAFDMTVRHRNENLALTVESVGTAFPAATGRLAVFVHGLCETDDSWRPSSSKQRKTGAFDFGERLTADTGSTPVHIRYNSGLHVSDNGAALDRLLDDLIAVWPVPVSDVALIGHSMGGLVARSACHQGAQRNASWIDHIHHVVCLGTPHLGAPLERGTNAVSWILDRIPETKGLARMLNARSVGVKDLRFGSLLEDDWKGVDPDEFLTDRCNEVPFLSNVTYYFIGVTVTRNKHHPLGMLVGDLLVQFPSASGNGGRRTIPFGIDNGQHLGGLNHFDLLSHPDVYEQLQHWLAPDRSPVPAEPSQQR